MRLTARARLFAMPETRLTHGDGQDLLAAFKEAWERRDPEAMVALFAEDAEFRPEPFAEPLVGHNAIRALWNGAAANQVHVDFDAERIWVVGNSVLVSWHAAYTRRATAERVRARGFMTLEVGEERLITRLRSWPAEKVVGVDSTARPEMEVSHGR